jgi:hypothetical protein
MLAFHLGVEPLDGEAKQLVAVLEPELVLDVGPVGLNGLDAQVESVGHIARLVALADEPEDLQLAVAERLDG